MRWLILKDFSQKLIINWQTIWITQPGNPSNSLWYMLAKSWHFIARDGTRMLQPSKVNRWTCYLSPSTRYSGSSSNYNMGEEPLFLTTRSTTMLARTWWQKIILMSKRTALTCTLFHRMTRQKCFIEVTLWMVMRDWRKTSSSEQKSILIGYVLCRKCASSELRSTCVLLPWQSQSNFCLPRKIEFLIKVQLI